MLKKKKEQVSNVANIQEFQRKETVLQERNFLPIKQDK